MSKATGVLCSALILLAVSSLYAARPSLESDDPKEFQRACQEVIGLYHPKGGGPGRRSWKLLLDRALGEDPELRRIALGAIRQLSSLSLLGLEGADLEAAVRNATGPTKALLVGMLIRLERTPQNWELAMGILRDAAEDDEVLVGLSRGLRLWFDIAGSPKGQLKIADDDRAFIREVYWRALAEGDATVRPWASAVLHAMHDEKLQEQVIAQCMKEDDPRIAYEVIHLLQERQPPFVIALPLLVKWAVSTDRKARWEAQDKLERLAHDGGGRSPWPFLLWAHLEMLRSERAEIRKLAIGDLSDRPGWWVVQLVSKRKYPVIRQEEADELVREGLSREIADVLRLKRHGLP